MGKTEKILVLSSIVLVGFTAAVIFHYILGFYLGLGGPYNSFLFGADYAFCDFVELVPLAKGLAPYHTTSAWIGYFPLTYILLFPLALIKNKYIAYLIFASMFMIFLVFTNFSHFWWCVLS